MPGMYFGSLAELIHMAGHGAFVWSAYAIVFAVILGLAAGSRARSRDVLQRVRKRLVNARPSDVPEA
jgi:heme exporter protein D